VTSLQIKQHNIQVEYYSELIYGIRILDVITWLLSH